MILREESAPDLEHSCYFLKSGFPVRHVVQHGKVEDGIESTLLVGKISDIAPRDSCSVTVVSEPVPCPFNHPRIEVDGGDASSAKILQLCCDALTGTAADVEDVQPFSAPTKGDELWNNALPESFGPQTTVYIDGLGQIHLHSRNFRTL